MSDENRPKVVPKTYISPGEMYSDIKYLMNSDHLYEDVPVAVLVDGKPALVTKVQAFNGQLWIDAEMVP